MSFPQCVSIHSQDYWYFNNILSRTTPSASNSVIKSYFSLLAISCQIKHLRHLINYLPRVRRSYKSHYNNRPLLSYGQHPLKSGRVSSTGLTSLVCYLCFFALPPLRLHLPVHQWLPLALIHILFAPTSISSLNGFTEDLILFILWWRHHPVSSPLQTPPLATCTWPLATRERMLTHSLRVKGWKVFV